MDTNTNNTRYNSRVSDVNELIVSIDHYNSYRLSDKIDVTYNS